eukprot:TRINITY_DN2929_c0_g1_i3.p1 TRINITY_DN2929_c0_g1~~TRINITY_DN2929_c0_g1_i3.p1  ORF type:complete len:100 (+),score=4.36 TRINITY_DN2929_c0_g1_i3:102-401(+)
MLIRFLFAFLDDCIFLLLHISIDEIPLAKGPPRYDELFMGDKTTWLKDAQAITIFLSLLDSASRNAKENRREVHMCNDILDFQIPNFCANETFRSIARR